ncbi:hypothetical protein HNP84_009065 [Thermocatellispora tengchongensis]|uniref:Uncharacterized protein n=1 Tax=Thermocatellispora tengchongensis TaxID=1073253 RepID=A0A840PJL3_9ACTN|nr:hypothetical protein [Thermocatellispora tengchongensis]MBB5139302.1 hypothetical protein [Thermocatellispora tengchongensis]
MTYTESDLRRLLTERVREQDGGEPSAHLDAIVRRGRRTRRTRRAMAAGGALALAVAAAGLMNVLPAAQPGTGETAAAQQRADSARVERGPELPETYAVVLGAERFDLALIHSRHFETMGVAQKVTFSPSTFSTGYKVVCDDPRAWVVTVERLKGGEPGGTAGRCDSSVGGHHDRLSAPSDWLKRPQSLQVWVFPADAPVREVAEAVTGCPVTPVSKDCDEKAQSQALMRPEVRERLSAQLGERPGRWAVGVYDRPAEASPGPD